MYTLFQYEPPCLPYVTPTFRLTNMSKHVKKYAEYAPPKKYAKYVKKFKNIKNMHLALPPW
jgi:hypothetical protein